MNLATAHGSRGVDPRVWTELLSLCPGRVRLGVEMKHLTTLRVGGPADAVVEPADPQDVARILDWCRTRGIPWMVVGRGSNLLVRDGGIRGVVLRLGKPMGELKVLERGGPVTVVAQAGCSVRRLVREASKRGLSGVAFLTGIPGHLGGALAMNAGTGQGTMDGIVQRVRWVDPQGQLVTKAREDLSFGYRSLAMPEGSVIVEAVLALERAGVDEVRQEIRQRMAQRMATQPLGRPSAGSIFKNPPGEHAGRLIERAGLKGLAVGEAVVSERHANFILNLGRAKASHVLALMELIQRRVEEQSGIRLEPEVRVVGEDE